MKQLDRKQSVREFNAGGAKWRVKAVRTAYLNDGSVSRNAWQLNRQQIKARLPKDITYDSSVSFYQCRNSPILLEEEILVERVSGEHKTGAPFELKFTWPVPSSWKKVADTPAHSTGRFSVPLDFTVLMPSPIVNVPAAAPAPAPVIRNEVEVNIPQTQKLTIVRDADGKITGADIQRGR
jgi:hypothetical protein